LNFTHRISGDVGGHEDSLWLLVLCQIARDCCLNLLLINVRARLWRDDRYHGLAKISVRDTDYGAFSNAWDRLNRGFDLGWINIVAAGDDEVLGASCNINVASLIDVAEIARDDADRSLGQRLSGLRVRNADFDTW
jgi:hypothetical protein